MNAFVCSSPVQVMRAIHMKMRHNICSDSADIFITHTCPKHKQIINNLKKINLFLNVYDADTSDIGSHVTGHLIFGHIPLAKIIRRTKYNKLFAFNIEGEVGQAIFNVNKHNPEFEYHCIEDAPVMYSIYEPPKYKWWHPFKWMGIDMQAYHVTTWWTSCPEFISLPVAFHTSSKEKLTPISIKDDAYLKAVNSVFEYKADDVLETADILIMDESFFTDGLMNDNADFKLYKRIQLHYPDKKIAVKMHPRTAYNRYAGNFQIMEKNDIPWELYVLNRAYNNEKKKLIQISIACTTMLSDKFMFGIEGMKIILAPLFYDKIKFLHESPRVSKLETQKYKMVKKLYKDPENFMIISTEDEIYKALDRLLEKQEQLNVQI